MRLLDFSASRARPILEFGSRDASALSLGHGHGDAFAYAIHVAPGGMIGPHPAGYDQLFLVVQGSGWIERGDGVRHELRAGTGAHVERGETHAKGSVEGMLAIMVQVTDLTAAALATGSET